MMQFKPYPGDPRDPKAIVEFEKLKGDDGEIVFSTVAMVLSFGSLVVKHKLIAWSAIISVIIAFATERRSSTDLVTLVSTLVLCVMSLVTVYINEIITLSNMLR